MPDISMCLNQNCLLKEKCYRFKANPSTFWQSYTNFIPDKSGKCDSYIENVELNESIKQDNNEKNNT
jgi:hypothetical protein